MVMLEMKHKYLSMQDELKERALSDHYIDVLKDKVEELQVNNHSLNRVIDQQTHLIDHRELTFVHKLTQLNQHYAQ